MDEFMKKTLIINGLEIEIELISLNGNSVKFDYKGQTHEFSLSFKEQDLHILKNGNNRLFRVTSPEKGVFITEHGTFTHQENKQEQSTSTEVASGKLTAPLPGKVIKVVRQTGNAIAPGDEILVLEAMKMEHRICASTKGVLKELTVVVGDTVDEGFLLAVIE
jgi:acetyl/propionyl-CoA carboxylase alpha subunit